MRFLYKKRGFTLVEVLFIVAIIALLASVVIFSIQSAKQKARDTQRISDIEQLAVVLRLYVDTYGGIIDCPDGIRIDGQTIFNPDTDILKPNNTSQNCSDGQKILDFITSSMPSVPIDPRGPGSSDYYYYFESSHLCEGSVLNPMVFAVNLESMDTNVYDVCTDQQGNDGGYSETVSFGGSIDPSKPYVKVLNFIQH